MMKNQTNHKRVVYSLSLVALLLVSGVTVASEPVIGNTPALIIVDEPSEINAVAETVKEMNGTVSHIFPPQAIIGQLSVEAEEHLLQNSDITVYRGPVDIEECENWAKETKYAAIAWNNNYMGLSVDAGLNEPPVDPESPPDDMEVLPDISSYMDLNQHAAHPYGAEFLDTSEYLVGSVAVGVFFLESNGTIDEDTEMWTEEEEAQVTSEIQNALNWLQYQEYKAHLTFVYEWHYSVPVGYEPISRPHTDDDLWEQQAMFYLGYTNPHYLVNEYTFVNDLRLKYDTDWAFIIFVVDSSEDGDNSFSDGYYAYSFLGGPRMVITYSNSIWGIANMDSIVAHETCHIFWALDQHCDNQIGQTEISGYLAGENVNSEWNGESCTVTTPCIMKGEPMMNSTIEVSTRTQLGWLDSDSDGILDVLDTVPDIAVNREGDYYTGTTQVSPLPNENPMKEGNPVSLNTITTVQYRVDQGEWIEAEPTDGSFDEPEEGFAFTVDVDTIVSGEYIISVRAQNSAGNWSEPATVTVTVEEPDDTEDDTQTCLHTEVVVSPSAVNTGDTVLVTMTVQNTGEAPILSVVPVLTAPESVEKVSGPEPESQDIAPGDSVTFEWVYQVTATEGTLVFSGSAHGYTESEEEVSSPSTESAVEVHVEPLLNSDITALLYGVIEGTTVTVTMEVHNAGEVTLENVTPSELSVSSTGTASASFLTGPLPESITTLEPGETKTFEWKYTVASGAQGGTAVFTGTVSGEAEGESVTSDAVKATVGVESPAILTCFIIATPREVNAGEIITVAMTVQNIGQAEAVNVIPSELQISGTGKVKLESGPSRTSVNVQGRSFEIILWMYVAVQEGTVTFSGSAQGTDASTGEFLSVPEKESNPLTINAGSDDTGESDTDTGESDAGAGESDAGAGESDTGDTKPPPSNPSERARAERTIQKVRELLEKAKNLLKEKEKKKRDVRICSKLLYEAEQYLQHAENYLKMGKYGEANRRAIAALLKVHEALNCLEYL